MEQFVQACPIFSTSPHLNFLTEMTPKFRLHIFLHGALSSTQTEPKKPKEDLNLSSSWPWNRCTHAFTRCCLLVIWLVRPVKVAQKFSSLEQRNLLKFPKNVWNGHRARLPCCAKKKLLRESLYVRTHAMCAKSLNSGYVQIGGSRESSGVTIVMPNMEVTKSHVPTRALCRIEKLFHHILSSETPSMCLFYTLKVTSHTHTKEQGRV